MYERSSFSGASSVSVITRMRFDSGALLFSAFFLSGSDLSTGVSAMVGGSLTVSALALFPTKQPRENADMIRSNTRPLRSIPARGFRIYPHFTHPAVIGLSLPSNVPGTLMAVFILFNSRMNSSVIFFTIPVPPKTFFLCFYDGGQSFVQTYYHTQRDDVKQSICSSSLCQIRIRPAPLIQRKSTP